MDRKWKTGLIGGIGLALAVAGCVDERASVVMYGQIQGSGSVELIGEEFDEDGELTGEVEERVSCQLVNEFDEPDNVQSRGQINLTELALVGQPLVQGTYTGALRNQYQFGAVFENRLFDSRTVGAVSGGDGGGFENLELDKNDILIRSATVEFPGDANAFVDEDGNEEGFYDDLGYERLTNMLVQSGGGVSTQSIPLIANAYEREILEAYIDAIPADVHTFVARIQLFGETLGGEEVESNSIDFPVDMCSVDWIDEEMLGWSRNDWQAWFSDPTDEGWDMGVWEDFFGEQIEGETPEAREQWVLEQIDGWGSDQWEVWIGEQDEFLNATSWREWTDEEARMWLVDRSFEVCTPTLGVCVQD